MLDLDIETTEYLSDEFYTGKSLKHKRKVKTRPKKITKTMFLARQANTKRREEFNKIFMDTYTLHRRVSRIIEIPSKPEPKNRIKYPMKYGDECISLCWRSVTGLFRCTPMSDTEPWYTDNKQYKGKHRVLYRKFMRYYDNVLGYYRYVRSFQAGRDAYSYRRFTRGKRSYRSIPNTWDDLHRSRSYYRNISWKHLSKFKKQWSKW